MRRFGLLVAGVLVLAGCGSDTAAVDSTELVCDEFAGYVRDGGDRAAVVESIGEVIGNAEEGVRDAYMTLRNTADGPAGQDIADDTFAQACFDAGWDG